ncbi:MAG: hypothetical protein JNK05_36180 [Myxococcales bacterium]|nr:hypothetical protein [Myxococcales bacterium]
MTRVADEAGEAPIVGRVLEDALLVHTTLGVTVERVGFAISLRRAPFDP